MEFTVINVHDDNSGSNNNNNTPATKTKGRRKIKIKKFERDTHLLITFSKRKSGICKKASELVTVTGCEIGFLVFSPAGKVFTSAYPSFNYIVGRYLCQIYNQHQDPPMPYAMEVFRQVKTQQLTNR
ncbi:Agamous-like MADS-box protein AGL62 [Linum grandiflorum]